MFPTPASADLRRARAGGENQASRRGPDVASWGWIWRPEHLPVWHYDSKVGRLFA